MSTMSISKGAFWWFAAVLFGIGIGAQQVEHFGLRVHQMAYQELFENELQESELEALDLLDSISIGSNQQKETRFKELTEKYRGTALGLFVYENDELKFWNNIEALPPFYFREFYRPTFVTTENGSYLFFVRSVNKNHWVVSIPLNHHYSFSNKYLQENSPILSGFSKYFNVGGPGKYDIPIALTSGQNVCSVDPKSIGSRLIGLRYLLYLSVLLLGVLAIRNKSYLQLATALVVYLVLHNGFWPNGVSALSLFSPTLYSGIFGIPSLGDLIAISLLLIGVFSLAQKTLASRLIARYKAYVSVTLLFLIAYDIGVNSLISIETKDILELDIWTFCVYGLFAFLLYHGIDRFQGFDPRGDGWVALSVLFLLIPVVFFLELPPLLLSIPLLQYILGWCLQRLSIEVRQFQLSCTVFIMIGLFSSIEYTAETQDRKKLPFQIKSIVNQRDQVAEFLLNDFRRGISDDHYIKSFFTNPFLPKSAVEERIQQLYLRGYLRKFDHDILFLPRKIKFGYQPDQELARKVSEIVTYQSERVSEGVFASKIGSITNAYVTQQHFTQGFDTIGSLYILLKEKDFYDQSIYPELLVSSDDQMTSAIDLSYAIYNKDTLELSKGEVDYRRTINLSKEEPVLGLSSDFNHFQYQPNDHMLYVLSLRKRSFFSYVSSFSVFTLFLLIPFFSVFIIYRAKDLSGKTFLQTIKPSLSTKIRLATILSVFLALLVLGYATAIYTQTKYKNESHQYLLNKLKKAELYFTEVANSNPLIFEKGEKIQEQVHQFSEVYQSDIDIFKPSGQLLASSQRLLYENGILEAQMDGAAHFELTEMGRSQFVHLEKVGLLTYSCAFAPIMFNGRVLAFVQLPYFTGQRDVKQDLASFFVTLFNIYLVLMVLLGVFAAFIARNLTKPLTLISSQLRRTSLLGYNQKIAWSKNDEIGALVKEYNEMIDKLDESAKRLADSKQAEAWQEMARQVAHEIKNPLTPMKLNIQQLKRAWSDDRPDIDQTFNRVTGILINQIDLLSRIASEFSSFAQMPSQKLKKIDLLEVLNNVSTLNNPNGTVVSLNTENTPIYIQGDEDQLFRAFNNIVKNGIQAVPTERNPNISINVSANNGMVVVEIVDNGSGIDPSQKDKIFVPNFSTKSSGMGLGLAIVKQIIDNHRGKIWFSSNNGPGTTFHISLPISGVY